MNAKTLNEVTVLEGGKHVLVGNKNGKRGEGWVVKSQKCYQKQCWLYSESPQGLDQEWLRFALEE